MTTTYIYTIVTNDYSTGDNGIEPRIFWDATKAIDYAKDIQKNEPELMVTIYKNRKDSCGFFRTIGTIDF